MTERTIFLSAGGTGGHLFPAEALAHELAGRGWKIHLATDRRAQKFTDSFPAEKIHIIRSATFASKNPLAIARTLWELYRGYAESRRLIAQFRPRVVVGFGGYPTIPPLIAARRDGVATLLQEQNAILGRANRFLSAGSDAIAVGFRQVGKDDGLAEKTVVTGNPLRPPVIVAAKRPYVPSTAEGPFNLLVFGGSQGARFFSEILPPALELLSADQRQRLQIIQQARPEDHDGLVAAYNGLNVAGDVAPFFANMPERIADAQLVICRAGASSVAELTAIGRPSILVPLPYSLDGDQAANGADLAGQGGAQIVRQSELTAEKLCAMLVDALNDPQSLAKTAANAKKAAMPDAAIKLADVVEHVAESRSIAEFKGNQV